MYKREGECRDIGSAVPGSSVSWWSSEAQGSCRRSSVRRRRGVSASTPGYRSSQANLSSSPPSPSSSSRRVEARRRPPSASSAASVEVGSLSADFSTCPVFFASGSGYFGACVDFCFPGISACLWKSAAPLPTSHAPKPIGSLSTLLFSFLYINLSTNVCFL